MKIITERHKEVEEDVRKLRSQLEELKRAVSDLRKTGGYTRFAETLLQAAWPKIRFYRATLEINDKEEITRLYSQIEEEIENIKRKSDIAYYSAEDLELNTGQESQPGK